MTQANRNHGTLAFAAAIMAGALGSTAATAQEDQMRVRLAGYDLSTESGAKLALRRSRQAAETFCGPESPRELLRNEVHRTCVTRMVAKAVDKLDVPRVTALYSSASGRGVVQVAIGLP